MSKIPWTQAPNLATPITVLSPPDVPTGEDIPEGLKDYFDSLTDFLQRQNEALTELAEENDELRTFLEDVLNTIGEYDRDAINGLAEVAGTAGGAYGAPEQALLNALITLANGLRANL